MGAYQCEKRHWLSVYEPERATKLTDAELERMAQGTHVTELARKRWPNGVLIEGKNSLEAVELTRQALSAGATVIFEAAFLVDGLFARVDVLERMGRRNRYRVIEVKSSLELKPEKHIPDIAFQIHVVQLSGLDVADAAVLTLNREFRCGGDLKDLFDDGWVTREGRTKDLRQVWKRVRKALPDVKQVIDRARAVESRASAPEIEVGRQCRTPNECPYIAYCEAGRHVWHVSRLPRIKRQQEAELREAGIHTFDVLPESFDLSPLQRRFVRAECEGVPYVGERLVEVLEGIAYPLAFIDFEAVQPGLPVFSETQPYERIPFQWSAHILSHADADPAHLEFLADAGSDPRFGFVETLREAMSDAATICYYSSYEPDTIRGLAEAGIPHALPMVDLMAERGLDLLDVVRDHLYLPEFRGRFSIKTVLPALAPGFGYSDLQIQGGDHAQLVFARMIRGEIEDVEATRTALLNYCRRDTEAMVIVFRALRRLAGLNRE